MLERNKTISKNFYDDEIKGVMEIDGKKVLYLKEGVKRRLYQSDLSRDSYYHPDQINHLLIYLKKYEDMMKIMYGGDDFSDQE